MAAGAGLQGSRTLYGFSGSASHVHQVSSPAHQVPAGVPLTIIQLMTRRRASRTSYKGTLQYGFVYSYCTIPLGRCKEGQAKDISGLIHF